MRHMAENYTFLYVINRYVAYTSIQEHFGVNMVLVLHGYDDNNKNVKEMEKSQRTVIISRSLEVIFDESVNLSQ